MANDFNKEERVAFEDILEGFEDALVLSNAVNKYRTDSESMERSGDTIWRPQPYIMNSYTGMDQSSNFNDKTQLSVPATISYEKSVPFVLDAKELRDLLQEGRLGDAAKQKLASDINVALMDVAANQSSLVVPISTSASGFSDVADADTLMNETGVPMWDRYLALSSQDYNDMAQNLANREYLAGKKSLTAYEKASVGEIAGFNTLKLDYANRITAAAGGASLTMSTLDGATNYHVPAAITSSPTTSERVNQDNRFQNITISDTTDVVAGDCFTIEGVYAIHAITKKSTGNLKTFRVIANVDSTHLTITPPIISAQGSSEAEKQYQNCEIATADKDATAAIVWLNKKATRINPFWQKDALEILPGRYAVPSGAGAGVLRGSTSNGIEIVWTKQYDIGTMKTKYRLDTLFGVVNKAPEMSGILLFEQS
jgi:hypothetical protein